VIVQAVRSYIGTPYRHQGRVPGKGLDCVGVAICALREVGIVVDEPDHYRMDPDSDVLIDCIRQVADPIPARDRQAGDLLVFWWSHDRAPKHVAVYVGGGRMVHSFRSYRSTVEEPVAVMSGKIHSAWRLRA